MWLTVIREKIHRRRGGDLWSCFTSHCRKRAFENPIQPTGSVDLMTAWSGSCSKHSPGRSMSCDRNLMTKKPSQAWFPTEYQSCPDISHLDSGSKPFYKTISCFNLHLDDLRIYDARTLHPVFTWRVRARGLHCRSSCWGCAWHLKAKKTPPQNKQIQTVSLKQQKALLTF